jgi:hypothetical protein
MIVLLAKYGYDYGCEEREGGGEGGERSERACSTGVSPANICTHPAYQDNHSTPARRGRH